MTVFHIINKNNLKQLEKHMYILEILKENKYEGRFVGGAVKNTLINEHINDIDIATNALPEEVMKIFQEKNITVIATGLQHGTVTVVWNKMHYEITTLRKDVKTYGRKADVEYINDWKEDAARRDFTMNAIFIDIEGVLYDYFNGIEDLKNGIVKFIGDPEKRITEDYLRILRYFRFITLYGNYDNIDRKSLDSCIKYKSKITTMSQERITKELLILLNYPKYIKSINIMNEAEVLQEIFTNKVDISLLQKFYDKYKNNQNIANNDNILMLKVFLLIAINFNDIKITAILTLSKKQMKIIETFYTIYQNFNSLMQDYNNNISKYIKYFYEDYFECIQMILEVIFDYKLHNEDEKITLPINSQDIMQAGYKGKNISNVKIVFEKFWIKNSCNISNEDAIKYIKDLKL